MSLSSGPIGSAPISSAPQNASSSGTTVPSPVMRILLSQGNL